MTVADEIRDTAIQMYARRENISQEESKSILSDAKSIDDLNKITDELLNAPTYFLLKTSFIAAISTVLLSPASGALIAWAASRFIEKIQKKNE